MPPQSMLQQGPRTQSFSNLMLNKTFGRRLQLIILTPDRRQLFPFSTVFSRLLWAKRESKNKRKNRKTAEKFLLN